MEQLKRIWLSVRHYARDLGWAGWMLIAFAGTAATVLWLIEMYFPQYYAVHLAHWAWWVRPTLVVIAVVVGPFMAFHRMRIQYDKLVEEQAKLKAAHDALRAQPAPASQSWQGISIERSSDIQIINSEINAPPSFGGTEPASDLTGDSFQGRTIKLRDLPLDQGMYLTNKKFEECILVGPAILLPMGNIEIRGFRFAAGELGLVWTIPDPNEVIGVIGVKDCRFLKCSFQKIALATSAPFVTQLRDLISGRESGGLTSGPPSAPNTEAPPPTESAS